ncbi:MAG: heavy metal transporter [Lacrimispora celerecrescens]|uniref:urease accessory protein UreH domain-containing protein n=1 Tax=Lacrimispora indolis TaxID=69825 RepID=UPI000408BE7A|nr:sulfite exporter TauE/SafE family protein [[Clostridium] methoxybenzovorans]MBE7720572.1 heavy metal transporter [Lacrimispora celerecrescens]
MGSAVRTKKIRIGGMTCISCQNKIEKKLRNTAGIEKAEVSYSTGTAAITFDTDIISYKSIVGIIEGLDYQVLTEHEQKGPDTSRAIGILLIIVSLYMLIQQFGLLNLLVPSQLADEKMGYGMLFVIGLVTSVHCVAMCGGINLSQCIPHSGEGGPEKSRFSTFRPTFLYNLGRVISYTAVGFLVGALGSVVTFSNTLQGVLKLLAGIFMVIMGINMLGIFPWLRRLNPRMPQIFARKIDKEKSKNNSPLIVGLLNGLMPCGPLQAMQIYALSTGNPFSGALSMFLFSLGTVPLMFGLGALSSALGKKFTGKVMTVGAVLVVVLGMSMFSQGLNLSGFQAPDLFSSGGGSAYAAGEQEKKADTKIEDGVQIINSTLSPGRYPNISVQKGIPVKWIIDAPKGSINGCNNRIIIRDLGIEYSFKTGENVIEFTPEKTGKISYSCWMGMIRGSIYVTEEGDTGNSAGSDEEGVLKQYAPEEPVAAGYTIPTDEIAVAEDAADEYGNTIQRITMELTDEGFKPAAAVVKSGVDVEWNIIDSTSDSTYGTELLVPDFATQLPLEKGENNLYFTPAGSFDFSTGDNAFYGYIKVVDDLNNIDMDGIKKEISSFKTMIWPEDTFQGAGGSCCG